MKAPGFVLVGGRSRRFGEDKALYPIGGVPMALRVAGAMQEAGYSVLLVAPRAVDLGLPMLLEADEGEPHPLRGVVAALRALAAEGQSAGLFAPCDLPGLTPEAVRRLCAAPGLRVASSGGRLHPLLSQIPVDELGFIEGIWRALGPCRALCARATAVEMEPEWTRNANEPGDLC